MRKIVLFLFVFALSLTSIKIYAQRDFRRGYLIDSKNDTVKGYILYNPLTISKTCSFRETPDGNIVDYSPSDIVSFHFDEGLYFVSKKINPEPQTKVVFLECLIIGRVSMYYMREDYDHYYIEKENRLVELSADPTVTIQNEHGDQFYKKNPYKGKLKALLYECKEVLPEIEKTDLSHASLTKLAQDYNKIVCPNETCLIFTRKAKPVHFNFGLHAGMVVNTISFGDGNRLTSNTGISGLLGARIEMANFINVSDIPTITFDFILNQYTDYTLTSQAEPIRPEFIVYKNKPYTLARAGNFVDLKSDISVSINALVLKIPIAINYTFLKGNFRPYLGGGLSTMYVLAQNKEFVLQRFYNEYKQSVPLFHFGYIAKAGAKIKLAKRFMYLEMSYESSLNLSTDQFLRFHNRSFSVMAGFYF